MPQKIATISHRFSGRNPREFSPYCKSAFDVIPCQIAWLTVCCRIERCEGGPLTYHPGSRPRRCPRRTPSSNFNHPFRGGREWRGERRDLATDALLYFVNVSIDHRMLLGFAPFYCPSSSIPHAHYGVSRPHCWRNRCCSVSLSTFLPLSITT